MELQSNSRKPLFSRDGKFAFICWNERKEQIEGTKKYIYKYSYVKIKYPFTYEQLVSKIVRSVYSEDEMEALINNYLSDSETYSEKFTEMQAFRQEAKEIAKRVLNIE